MLVRNLKKIVYALSPKKKAKGVWNTILQCNHIFNGFLFGKAIDSLIIGVLCLITMTICAAAQCHCLHYEYDSVFRTIYRSGARRTNLFVY